MQPWNQIQCYIRLKLIVGLFNQVLCDIDLKSNISLDLSSMLGWTQVQCSFGLDSNLGNYTYLISPTQVQCSIEAESNAMLDLGPM